jgi:hypothetical protein
MNLKDVRVNSRDHLLLRYYADTNTFYARGEVVKLCDIAVKRDIILRETSPIFYSQQKVQLCTLLQVCQGSRRLQEHVCHIVQILKVSLNDLLKE